MIDNKNETSLEVNITDDNNFYASHTLINDIKHRMKFEPKRVSGEEIQLVDKFEARKRVCEEQNIHYWILNDSTIGGSGFCHFCEKSLADYCMEKRLTK